MSPPIQRVRTPLRIRLWDSLMSMLIAVGGVSTILALLLVVLVLLWTALPLARTARVGEPLAAEISSGLTFGVDDSGLLLWILREDAAIEIRAVADPSEVLAVIDAPAFDRKITSWTVSDAHDLVVLGFDDGTISKASLRFREELITIAALPPALAIPPEGRLTRHANALYRRFDARSVQRFGLEDLAWTEPTSICSGAIRSLDIITGQSDNFLAFSEGEMILALADSSATRARLVCFQANSGSSLISPLSSQARVREVEIRLRSQLTQDVSCFLLAGGSQAIVAWPNGVLDRFAIGNTQIEYRETKTNISTISATIPLPGRQSILCGTEQGRLLAWSIAKPSSAPQTNERLTPTDGDQAGFEMVPNHDMGLAEEPIRALSSSRNGKTFAALHGQNLILGHLASETILVRLRSHLSRSKAAVGAVPVHLCTSNTLVAMLYEDGMELYPINLDHPESSWRSYLSPIWYEGHSGPEYIWQSTPADEHTEIKLSLVPLVFGTLKATFFTMLFSVPIAIMAAIYVCEFVDPAFRSRLRPLIELMASIPGVVIGYLFAVTIAPVFEPLLSSLLAACLVIPMTYWLLGSFFQSHFLRRSVPQSAQRRVQFLILAMTLPLALWLSHRLGIGYERAYFDGSFARWISERRGSPLGGWLLVYFFIFFGILWLVLGWLGSRLKWVGKAGSLPRQLANVALTLGCAALLAWSVATSMPSELDLRNNLLSSYQDRNSMLVGIAISFCVIPLIYTIVEDALLSVPQRLRLASLACGASPWQTTFKIVVPTAASGIVAAIMIGIARAIGETMIVLMVVGNTPLLEWNPFSGMRTLTATLATELPEATPLSTHYRTLFLATLIIFVFTLGINTIAEYVRVQMRKRLGSL